MKGIWEKMRGYAVAAWQRCKSAGNFLWKYPFDAAGWFFLSAPLFVYAYIWYASCTTPSFPLFGLVMVFGGQLVAAGRYQRSQMSAEERHVQTQLATAERHAETQLATEKKYADTEKKKREQFFLESFVDAYAEAHRFLKAGNNDRADRAAWVAAGRAVASANGLAAEITEMAFRHVLEIHRLKHLRGFSDFLEKPAHFYYGAPIGITNIAKAAEWSTRRGTGRSNDPKDTSVPLRAIRPIWAAVQWKEDFESECKKMQRHLKKQNDPAPFGEIPQSEPLQGQGFSEEENVVMTRVSIFYPELYRYICHKRDFVSFDGELRPRKPQN